MAKKEQEMYEGMPIIEATDSRTLARKIEGMEVKPTAPYVVRFPKKTTKIKKDAFTYDNDIAVVIIPDSVTEICEWAFYNCKNLTTVFIPKSLVSIEGFVFDNCASLQSIIVEEGNPVFDSRNGCNAIIKTDTNELVVGCNNTIIPDSVTIIGESAFKGRGMTQIDIPNSVKEIGFGAFSGCKGLINIVIPESVEKIDSEAFSDCTNLARVDTPNLTAWNAMLKNSMPPTYRLYINGEEAKDLVIPDSVTEIGCNAFNGCTSLNSIKIPDSVTKIEECAFKNCINLTKITIPDSVKEIGEYAFFGCTSLPLVDGIRYAGIYLIEAVDKAQTAIQIKEGTKFIGSEAFKEYDALASITIPESVAEIGKDAFFCCMKLNRVDISNLEKWCTMAKKSLPPNYQLFVNGEEVKEVVFPDSMTKIGFFAFFGCKSLTSITIPDSVIEIEWNAFAFCSNLTNVVMGNSVTSIQARAFDECTNLKSIVIPDSLTDIGRGAFPDSTEIIRK